MKLAPVVLLCLASVSSFSVSARAAEATAPSTARVAIELSDAQGHTVQLQGEHLSWGETHRIANTVDDHRHSVAIAVTRADDGVLSVALTYERDGAKVIERKRVRASVAEPVRLATEDGDAQVVFVVEAEAPREKLEVDGSDDPLGGL